jgi:heme exporter protein D
MIWNSPAEFFAMGGYALYVWMSFGVCLALMVLEPIFIKLYKKQIMKRIQQELIAKKYQKERL